jgi:hypothetical protein
LMPAPATMEHYNEIGATYGRSQDFWNTSA